MRLVLKNEGRDILKSMNAIGLEQYQLSSMSTCVSHQIWLKCHGTTGGFCQSHPDSSRKWTSRWLNSVAGNPCTWQSAVT